MKLDLARPWHRSHLRQPALALGYLAAVAKKAGHRVRVHDGLLLGPHSTPQIVRACHDADLVGISVLSDYAREAADLSSALSQNNIPVLWGGPHATTMGRACFDEAPLDWVSVGEGEETLEALLASLARGETSAVSQIPGLLASGLDHFTPRPLVEDLDRLPFPDWEDTPPARYGKAPHGGVAQAFPVAPVTSSRGCPYNCSFCASPALWGRKIRYRSAANVVDEIEQLVRRYRVKEIHFEDDNLTLKRAHAAGIAEELLRRNLKISWATPNGIRADKLDRPLVKLLKTSGLYSVAFGIESADPGVLRRCNKRASLDKIDDAIRIASEEGLITQGFFILGLPGETRETLERTIQFAAESRLDKAQFLLLDVMPGSALHRELAAELPAGPYQSFHDVTWCPPGLDRATLKEAQARAFRAFFLKRPARIAKMARMIRLSQAPHILRRLLDFRILPFRR